MPLSALWFRPRPALAQSLAQSLALLRPRFTSLALPYIPNSTFTAPCALIAKQPLPTPPPFHPVAYCPVEYPTYPHQGLLHLSPSHLDTPPPVLQTYNLGTGEGVSVKQLAAMFERVTGRPVPCAIRPRRTGDIVSMFANASLAKEELGWTAKRSLEDMCKLRGRGGRRGRKEGGGEYHWALSVRGASWWMTRMSLQNSSSECVEYRPSSGPGTDCTVL